MLQGEYLGIQLGLGDEDPERRQAAWLRAGEIARDHLDDGARALRHFESAARVRPLPPVRLAEWAELYDAADQVERFAEVFGAWLDETFGIRFMFSWTGAALAAGIITLPFQVRAIRLSMEAIDPGLMAAAETLGAGPIDRFASITLPLAAPGILAGAITAFAASLGEFGAIITFVSNIPGETRTLPLAIYTAIQTPGGEAAAARLVLIAIALAFAGLILSEAAAWRLKRLAGR